MTNDNIFLTSSWLHKQSAGMAITVEHDDIKGFVLGPLFKVSNCIGLFPFIIGFHQSYKTLLELVLLIFPLSMSLYTNYLLWTNPWKEFFKFEGLTLFTNVFTFPFYVSSLIAPLSGLILILKRNKLISVFINITKVEKIMSLDGKNNWKSNNHLFILYTIAFLIECYVLEVDLRKNGVLLSRVPTIFAIMVVQQFISILQIIQNKYNHLLKTFDKDSAVKWTECQEILVSSCSILMDCYSLQLLTFLLCMQIFSIYTGFLIVSRLKSNYYARMSISLTWLFVNVFLVWSVIFNCRCASVKVSNAIVTYLLLCILQPKQSCSTLSILGEVPQSYDSRF